MTKRTHEHRTTSEEQRRSAIHRIGLRRALRVVAGLRSGYIALGVLTALAWALVGVPRDELPGAGGVRRRLLTDLFEGSFRTQLSPLAHAIWLAARGAAVATIASAIVEVARRPLAWGLAAVGFQVVVIVVDLAVGVSQPGQVFFLIVLLGMLPGCAIVATQIRRDRAAWIATLVSIRMRRRATAGEPGGLAVRNPRALAQVLHAGRAFYAIGALLAGFVACAFLGIGPIASPTHYRLDVAVLSTLCSLFAFGTWRLWKDPAAWSMVVAIGATVLAVVRYSATGIETLQVIWMTVPVLTLLGALAASLRGAPYVMHYYPDHRFVRRLEGERAAFEPSKFREQRDERRIAASRRAFQRSALFFAIGAVVVSGTATLFFRLVSPPPLIPAVERYVAEWNAISEQVRAGTHDGISESHRADADPWDTDPYYVPNPLEGQVIEMPDPFVAESLEDPTAWLVLLLRNARHGVNVKVRFPVVGREPEALVVRFRWGPRTDGWVPVKSSTGRLLD